MLTDDGSAMVQETVVDQFHHIGGGQEFQKGSIQLNATLFIWIQGLSNTEVAVNS